MLIYQRVMALTPLDQKNIRNPSHMRTMVLVYLPTKLGDFVANDGKYSSTMVRIWASMGMLMEV